MANEVGEVRKEMQFRIDQLRKIAGMSDRELADKLDEDWRDSYEIGSNINDDLLAACISRLRR